MSSEENNKDKRTSSMKIGFQFKKISKPKSNLLSSYVNNKINDLADVDQNKEIDFVTSIDNKTIKGTKTSLINDQIDYVIPLIKVNKYKYNKIKSPNSKPPPTKKDDSGDDANNAVEDLLSRAKQELFEESKVIGDDEKLLPAWKSLLINKLPEEFENDSKCDVSMRPEEPKLEDYKKIPVDVYGAAMLRGMGWKEGDAIGGINKAVTPIIEPQLRPRGLGLGADISLKKQLEENSKSDNNSKDILRKGCHICIEFGPYKGYYGIIESISGEDSIYASIKLALTKNTIMLPQDILRIVTKKEFDLESKVINKNRYDEYKEKEKESYEKHFKEKKSSFGDKNDEVWIVPRIRAQIIDKKYKDGKYYKDKILILETRGRECICRTKDKKILNHVSQSMLRTVIPSSDSLVMVVRGNHKGKLAKIEQIDWKHNSATISLVGFISKPFSVLLDDISEFRDDR